MFLLVVVILSIACEISQSYMKELVTIGVREEWPYPGEDVRFSCGVRNESPSYFCNTTKKSRILNFHLKNNNKANRRYIRQSARVECTDIGASVILRNVSQEASGLFWCGRRKRNTVDINVIEPIRKYTNISCIFHGKKILNCSYSVHDDIGFNQYSCAALPLMVDNKCSVKTSENVDRLNFSNTSGLCSYVCGDCTENIALFIRGRNVRSNETFCHVAELLQLIKPDPVRSLNVTKRNGSSIRLQWYRPDTDTDCYKYNVSVKSSRRVFYRTITTSKDRVSLTIAELWPGYTYNITVVASPKEKGFTSEPAHLTVSTKEEVPTSGPVFPPGSFSVWNQNELAVYWQNVPLQNRCGKIVEYQIQIGSSNLSTKADKMWTEIKIPSSKEKILLKLRAATTIGFSNATNVIIRLHLGSQRVSLVQRVGNVTRWKITGARPDITRVHRCYGRQDVERPQIVDCKTEIEVKDATGSESKELLWLSRPSPPLSCSLCDWHYAVSVHDIGDITSGMVWNTNSNPYSKIQEIVPASINFQIAVIVSSLSVLLILGFLSVLIVVKKRKSCSSYTIVLPRDSKSHGLLQVSKKETKVPVPSAKYTDYMPVTRRTLNVNNHQSVDGLSVTSLPADVVQRESVSECDIEESEGLQNENELMTFSDCSSVSNYRLHFIPEQQKDGSDLMLNHSNLYDLASNVSLELTQKVQQNIESQGCDQTGTLASCTRALLSTTSSQVPQLSKSDPQAKLCSNSPSSDKSENVYSSRSIPDNSVRLWSSVSALDKLKKTSFVSDSETLAESFTLLPSTRTSEECVHKSNTAKLFPSESAGGVPKPHSTNPDTSVSSYSYVTIAEWDDLKGEATSSGNISSRCNTLHYDMDEANRKQRTACHSDNGGIIFVES